MQWSWPLSGNHSKNHERRKMIKWDLIPRPLSLGTEPVLLVRKLEAVNPVFRTGHLNFLPLMLIAASLGSSKAFLTGYCFSLQLGWYLNPTAQPSRSSLFVSGPRGHSCPFLSYESARLLLLADIERMSRSLWCHVLCWGYESLQYM